METLETLLLAAAALVFSILAVIIVLLVLGLAGRHVRDAFSGVRHRHQLRRIGRKLSE